MSVLSRRLVSFTASLAIAAGMSVIASPAQAAVNVDLSVNDTTITEGQDVTVSWTSAEAIDLVASGDWSGNKANPTGSQVIAPAIGSHTYTLAATDENGRESTDTVTVDVAPGPITPNAVTFPDTCTVVIPTTPHVTYFVSYGGPYSEEVAPGTFPGIFFYTNDGTPATFLAKADEGYTLADDAPASWEFTATEDCLEYGPDLVTTEVTCKTVRFTNIYTESIFIQAGSSDAQEPDVSFELAPGASRAVHTNRNPFYYVASYDTQDGQNSARHSDEFDVRRDCGSSDGGSGSGSGHPTVAPAAGISAR